MRERPVDKEIEVAIDYSTFKEFDPYGFHGFPGMLTRLQQMKQLLDDQWGIDTVYQDQYPSLLLATQTGRMITAQPSLVITGIMEEFKKNLMTGIEEVCMDKLFLMVAEADMVRLQNHCNDIKT